MPLPPFPSGRRFSTLSTACSPLRSAVWLAPWARTGVLPVPLGLAVFLLTPFGRSLPAKLAEHTAYVSYLVGVPDIQEAREFQLSVKGVAIADISLSLQARLWTPAQRLSKSRRPSSVLATTSLVSAPTRTTPMPSLSSRLSGTSLPT